MENIQQRLKTLQQELQTGLVGRTQAVKIALLALLAEENVLLVGPPGTAKSLLARKIAQSIQSSEEKDTVPYFEYLLTKFSTPEEIFGPLSISELKKDCFKRNTLGYLPSAQVGFLDEIFKASSSILNSLLTIMNEKLYHNGTTVVPTPLRSLIAASNELPSGQEELEALYDRFLLRQYVGYVADNDITHLINVIASSENAAVKPLSPYELAKIKELSVHVKLPERIMQVLKEIWLKHREAFKEDRRESLSDRRLVKVVNLLKVSAATNGRSDVDLSDVLLLIHCLWNHPDNAGKVNEIITSVIKRYSSQTSKIENLYSDSPRLQSESANVAANDKIKGMQGSGTEYDPFIIRSTADFMRLTRDDISCAGYHFSQEADIEISSTSHLGKIKFKGVYQGNAFKITFENNGMLFDQVLNGSEVSGINVTNGTLTKSAAGARFTAITTAYWVVYERADMCEFNSCKSYEGIVGCYAEKSNFNECLSYKSLVSDDINKYPRDVKCCEVNNCMVELNHIESTCVGGVTTGTAKSTVVRNLFVCMEVDDDFLCKNISGIAQDGDDCVVSGCVIGDVMNAERNKGVSNHSAFGDSMGRAFRLAMQGKFISVFNLFCHENDSVNNLLSDNYLSASASEFKHANNAMPDHKSIGGGIIPDEAFNQDFFENILGWDFDSIWQWNAQHNRPELQRVGVAALKKTSASFENEQSQTPLPVLNDELTQNIWL
ncbi:ATPase ravA [Plesiomonas shigelloides]|uniref:AAA family ATPase n=1 Tax=Plesiomonas shigelloides TaxID=703 RepID=UPI000DA0E64F|nr:AAA family ATPase [Plesiomonas shigelloides]SPZ45271.1 ATPase ravA [Plesiomonas shigelloides]